MKSEEKDRLANAARTTATTSNTNTNHSPSGTQKPHEAISYASNSVSSSSTSTTSASSSLSTPSKTNEQEPSQKQNPVGKDLKMALPPVSVKGKDFFISKIQSHITNGTSGMKMPNTDGSTLADNMDSFLTSLAGPRRKKV